MTPELVLPNDYPVEILQLRAIDHLSTQMDQALLAKTGKPIRMAGLLIGLVVLAGYLDVVAGGFLSGLARDLYTLVQMAMVAGIVACLGQAFLIGRRMQQSHEARCQDIRDGKLCPLTVLNARLEDLQSSAPALAVEPKAIIAEDLATSMRTLQAEKALQANFEKATQMVKGPSLEDVVAAPPQTQPRRITLN